MKLGLLAGMLLVTTGTLALVPTASAADVATDTNFHCYGYSTTQQ